ncbi:potassium channel family protein [Saccharopolyspora mangrovi]|uniref:TrkA family potassium uptake protein n=1 Tax=Saccharopolyspora mangrovi TaxID=3082379 RepID=A0ABU6A7K2_9PSEU|nr:TrkA family potassium uptake protein [Saccharopolyspora sp. S2-29]MEB3367481.1 TrkA family potassium uptake protein [Saccharopolyspora sp. S2-29]
MARNDDTNQIVVIGLGRFGSSLAAELVRRGSEVLALDSRPNEVQRHADELTHTAVADSTDPESLRQLGVHQFKRAVVAIGTDLEASILTTSLLSDFGIPHIWAKATSRQHGRILERVGAHHVVLPEHEMGERVAHLVNGRMLDYIELAEHYALVKTHAPAEAVGRTLGELKLRSKYGVTVVGIKRPGEDFTYATADTEVGRGDTLVVAGTTAQVEAFADRT